jgi:hypothetical protein
MDGTQVTIQENAAKVGVVKTAPLSKLNDYISDKIQQGVKVHFLPPYRAENKLWLEELLELPASKNCRSCIPGTY